MDRIDGVTDLPKRRPEDFIVVHKKPKLRPHKHSLSDKRVSDAPRNATIEDTHHFLDSEYRYVRKKNEPGSYHPGPGHSIRRPHTEKLASIREGLAEYKSTKQQPPIDNSIDTDRSSDTDLQALDESHSDNAKIYQPDPANELVAPWRDKIERRMKNISNKIRYWGQR
jgi:hypothetical protein